MKRNLKANIWEVVTRAVFEGTQLGVNRAFKYSDRPSRDLIAENVEREVMNSLSEVINFGE